MAMPYPIIHENFAGLSTSIFVMEPIALDDGIGVLMKIENFLPLKILLI